MNITILSAGIACIVAGIIGGGMKGLGLEIPALESVRRQVLLVIFGFLLMLGGAFQVLTPLFKKVSSHQGVQPSASSEPASGSPVLNSEMKQQAALFARRGDSYRDAEDFIQAKAWYEKAAAGGDAEALKNLGLLYIRGQGVSPADPKKAAALFEQAAAAGNVNAMFDLGQLYNNGWGVAQDFDIARSWYERAASGGHNQAMLQLGLLYYFGNGLKAPDYSQAKAWFEKAAASRNTDAMYRLGELYYFGSGLGSPDYGQAKAWFEKAAAEENAEAMYMLGTLYDDSDKGVTHSYTKARAWYKKAASGGNAKARQRLKEIANAK